MAQNFWSVANGLMYGIGALGAIAAGVKRPVKHGVLSISMIFLMFWLYGLMSINSFYNPEQFIQAYSDDTAINQLKEQRLEHQNELWCFPLLWWFNVYLYFGLLTPHTGYQRLLMVLSAAFIIFSIVFSAI